MCARSGCVREALSHRRGPGAGSVRAPASRCSSTISTHRLAEAEHGHYVLAPNDPASLPLIKSWFAEIDSLFPSKFVHLGADETFELRAWPHERSRAAEWASAPCTSTSLKQIESAALYGESDSSSGAISRRGVPIVVKSLPKDMVAVGWGYGPNPRAETLMRPFINLPESRRGSHRV